MTCRHCGKPLHQRVIDLGVAPPSNAYLTARDLQQPELFFPLAVFVCHHCWLVQTQDYARADELFREDYAYFSSTSASWLEHASRYTDGICGRLGLDRRSFVLEIASNDGYLLKNFVARGIPCLGIEPTDGTAAAAEKIGIPVRREFFSRALGEALGREGSQADLIIGNNVYAHVPDINDFTAGLQAALKPGGTITLEFPHLLRLVSQCQFDTIYHEHFSYLSLYTVSRIFAAAGLRIFDVERLPTHGGSLRIYGGHAADDRPPASAVAAILAEEAASGLQTQAGYTTLAAGAGRIKNALVSFLIGQKSAGKKVVAYGAAAKGNTLINYAGIKPDLLAYVCDEAASKQGKFLPGSRIPIVGPAELQKDRPDVVLILPWNIADEVMSRHGYIWQWGARFAVAVPEMKILEG